jgi:hypothetical protein
VKIKKTLGSRNDGMDEDLKINQTSLVPKAGASNGCKKGMT